MNTEGVKEKFQDLEYNKTFNTFDIMRNYLENQETFKILEHLFSKMNFVSLTQIILTANNLTSISFIHELKLSFSN